MLLFRAMDIAIDVQFEGSDAFQATVYASPPPAIAPTPAQSRTVWWPIAICGLVAVAFATAAFLKSPLAAHPQIAPYAQAAIAYVD